MDLVGCMRGGALVLGTAVLAAAASPAFAGSDSATATMDVAGRVAPSCTVTLPERHSLGDLTRAGEAVVNFTLNCNQRLVVAMRSEEGGLRHPTAEGYLVPYSAQIELMDDAAALGSRVESTDMRVAPVVEHVGEAAPFDESGRLHIRWEAPPHMLASGTYRDVLTITLVGDGQ